jgi:hypothetical protein
MVQFRCVIDIFFLNFKYSRGDPHCKDFIIRKDTTKRTTPLYKEEPGSYN